MLKKHTPTHIAPPFGRYSHGVEVAPNAAWLVISGQVGVAPSGDLGDGIEAQCDLAWRNVLAILEQAGMGPDNLVKVTVFLTDSDYVGAYRDARDRYIGDARAASTLLVVSGLADSRWLAR